MVRPQPVKPSPGDFLLHPLALAALALWAVNDHVLKPWWGNGVTGKLSDVASLAVFPLLLVAAVEIACALARRPVWRSPWSVWCAVGLTGFVMVAINLWPEAADVYRHGLGLAQWPFLALWAVVGGWAAPSPGLVHLTMDPTDLVTLPALALAVWIHPAGRASLRSTDGAANRPA